MPLTKAEITRLRSLQEKKHRDALGLFVVEGPKVVGELLAAHFPFVDLYATQDWFDGGGVPSPREASSTPDSGVIPPWRDCLQPKLVTPAEMARISHYPTPSAVLA